MQSAKLSCLKPRSLAVALLQAPWTLAILLRAQFGGFRPLYIPQERRLGNEGRLSSAEVRALIHALQPTSESCFACGADKANTQEASLRNDKPEKSNETYLPVLRIALDEGVEHLLS